MPIFEIYERLRAARGVSDYAVAKACGLRKNIFSEWRAGRCSPKADKIMKLAAYFVVPVTLFYKDPDAQGEAVNG